MSKKVSVTEPHDEFLKLWKAYWDLIRRIRNMGRNILFIPGEQAKYDSLLEATVDKLDEAACHAALEELLWMFEEREPPRIDHIRTVQDALKDSWRDSRQQTTGGVHYLNPNDLQVVYKEVKEEVERLRDIAKFAKKKPTGRKARGGKISKKKVVADQGFKAMLTGFLLKHHKYETDQVDYAAATQEAAAVACNIDNQGNFNKKLQNVFGSRWWKDTYIPLCKNPDRLKGFLMKLDDGTYKIEAIAPEPEDG